MNVTDMTPTNVLDIYAGQLIEAPLPAPAGTVGQVMDLYDGRRTGLGIMDVDKYRTIVFVFPGNYSQHRAVFVRDASIRAEVR